MNQQKIDSLSFGFSFCYRWSTLTDSQHIHIKHLDKLVCFFCLNKIISSLGGRMGSDQGVIRVFQASDNFKNDFTCF